jgi:ankyrin repeat protein
MTRRKLLRAGRYLAVLFLLLAGGFAARDTRERARATEELRAAVTERDAGRVRWWLAHGADPNARFGVSPSLSWLAGWLPGIPRAASRSDRSRRTVLMEAMNFGDVTSATALLQSGADPDAQDKDGRTVEQYAKANCPEGLAALRQYKQHGTK